VVTVRASNSVSNESATVEFIVAKPVIGLSINTSTEYIHVGTEVLFQAAIVSGTNVHFDWDFGDLESAADAGKSSASFVPNCLSQISIFFRIAYLFFVNLSVVLVNFPALLCLVVVLL